MNPIALNLNLNETNAILTALAKMPFEQVNELIHKIQTQASEQLKPKQESEKPTE